jgi:3-oxoacyl-[acyl-carrier-protein] synthase-3
MFTSWICRPADIDFLLFWSQTLNYVLPATACSLQGQLRISMSAGALDFRLGSPGFVQRLGPTEGLITSGQVRSIFFITADSISKYMGAIDNTLRLLFGDRGAATLITPRGGGRVRSDPSYMEPMAGVRRFR